MTFEQALRMAGLRPREVVADGRWRRCATDDKPLRKNGAYVLYPWGIGHFRNRAVDGTENHKWEDGTRTDHTPSAEHLERMRRQREQERADRLAGIRRAREQWARATPCRLLHPYLQRKGLSALGTVGLRELDGWLVIPVLWRGSVISIQRIHPDGTKRFAVGAPVKGGHYVIDRPRAALTVICEGLATGLALFQCLRQARVLIAFDAGNLLPVIQAVKPTGSVVIAADNDAGTQARRGFNPGLDKARNAAELIGCGVAYPEGIEGTDFCDLLREHGPQAAKRIERLVQAGARYVGVVT